MLPLTEDDSNPTNALLQYRVRGFDSAYRLSRRKCQMQLVQLIRAPNVLVQCPYSESNLLNSHLSDFHF